MENCIFCKIVRGEIPSTKVLETEDVLVFRDIHPQAPQHLLVIPKTHVAQLNELGDDALTVKLIAAAKQSAEMVGIHQSGYRLVTNCNPDSGQEVYHIHFHVLGGKSLGGKLVSA